MPLLVLAVWLGLFVPLLGATEETPVPPAESPVTIVEFTDFQCPFCARALPIRHQLMDEYPGRIRWEIRHFPLGFHDDAMLAHQAALAAGEQGKFWEMHDLLFANRHALKRDQLITYAQRLGLDQGRFLADLDSPRLRERITADLDEGRRRGVRGTPTFFVNGKKMVGAKPYAAFKAQVDQALGIKSLPKAPSPATAPRQTVAPKVGNAPILGPTDAPVTIIAFSDFQCPYCRRSLPVIEALRERYPGKIRVAFKHFPLAFHKQSPRLHKMAIAAGLQGQFWEMHDRLFALRRAPNEQQLAGIVTDLSLDSRQFYADIDAPELDRRIQDDIAEGRAAGVTGTPTFFINGERLVGAKPIDAFAALVDRHLDVLGMPQHDDAVEVSGLAKPMTLGLADAPIRLTLFADFGSRLSAEAVWRMKRLLWQYPKRVRLEIRHFPMAYHLDSPPLHQAVLAAAEQGKGWEMLDLLLVLQERPTATEIDDIAAKLGLDTEQFGQALVDDRVAARLREDRQLGKHLGIRGVPTLFVNEEKFDGLPSSEQLQKILQASGAGNRVTAGLLRGSTL